MHEIMSTRFYILIFVIFAVVLSGAVLLVSKVMHDWEKRDERERSENFEPLESDKG